MPRTVIVLYVKVYILHAKDIHLVDVLIDLLLLSFCETSSTGCGSRKNSIDEY